MICSGPPSPFRSLARTSIGLAPESSATVFSIIDGARVVIDAVDSNRDLGLGAAVQGVGEVIGRLAGVAVVGVGAVAEAGAGAVDFDRAVVGLGGGVDLQRPAVAVQVVGENVDRACPGVLGDRLFVIDGARVVIDAVDSNLDLGLAAAVQGVGEVVGRLAGVAVVGVGAVAELGAGAVDFDRAVVGLGGGVDLQRPAVAVQVVGENVDRACPGVLGDRLFVVDGARVVIDAVDSNLDLGLAAAVQGVGEVVGRLAGVAVVGVGAVAELGAGAVDFDRAVVGLGGGVDLQRPAVAVQVVGENVDRACPGVLGDRLFVVDGARVVIDAVDSNLDLGLAAAVQGVGEVVGRLAGVAVVGVGAVAELGAGAVDFDRAVVGLGGGVDLQRPAVAVQVVGENVDRACPGVLGDRLFVVDGARVVIDAVDSNLDLGLAAAVQGVGEVVGRLAGVAVVGVGAVAELVPAPLTSTVPWSGSEAALICSGPPSPFRSLARTSIGLAPESSATVFSSSTALGLSSTQSTRTLTWASLPPFRV